MPIYRTRCTACSVVDSIYRRIADRNLLPACFCGGQLVREIEAPAVQADIPTYLSPITGKPISSRSQRRDDLARHGKIEWEPGIHQQIARRRADLQEESKRQIETFVDNTVRDLHTSGRL
jgi:hypothetical protein